jgi:hypothetical protein
MGEAELDIEHQRVIIRSHIITYGHAATEEITEQMREEIETMWNEPRAFVLIKQIPYGVQFSITAQLRPDLSEMEVLMNTDPKNNFFRIEEFVHGNISFVDGLGCNTGYFKLENLYKGSTTAAHEYGHTLGLDHPVHLDIRGEGVPGIMYPRGTLVDPHFQYDPAKPAGVTGGTMHPVYRKVKAEDVAALRLPALFSRNLFSRNRKAIVGDFTNVYHLNHGDISPEGLTKPPIFG